MTNTITISVLSEFRGYFAVADILTMKMQCTKVPAITEKRNVRESEAI